MPGSGSLAANKAGSPDLRLAWRASADDYVTALAWSADGLRLAAATAGGPVLVLDAGAGRLAERLAGHALGTLDLAWRPGASFLATAGQDGVTRLWEAESGAQLRELEGGSVWVERLAWSPDGELLATASGRSLRVWDADGKLLHDLRSPETVYDVVWRPKGRALATSGYGGVWIWRLDRPDRPRHLNWKGASLRLAWSPTGDYIATGDQDATVHFWLVASGKDLMASGYETKVRSLAWDRSGRFLATAGGSDILVWNCSGKGPAGTTPRSLESQGQVTSMAFQSDGPWLLSGDSEGHLVVWDPSSGRRNHGSTDIAGSVTQVAWGLGGRFAAATASGLVAVFDVTAG